MRTTLTALLLLVASPSFSQDSLKPKCVDLESSGSIALATMSNNHQLVAGLEPSGTESIFKLWNSKTGKLIKSQTLVGYEPTGDEYAELSFTAKDSYVYLTSLNISTPEFWHLASNNVVDKNCFGGATRMKISNDEKIVHMSFDNHHALCDLNKTAVTSFLYMTSYNYGNTPHVMRLFDTFATKKDDAFFDGIRSMHLDGQSHEEPALKALGDYLGKHLADVEEPPIPKPAQGVPEFLISGGYPSDKQYSKHHNFTKHDQYLFFKPVEFTSGWRVFILNWKTGEGHHFKLPGVFEGYVEHHWLPKSQQLHIQLNHEGTKVSFLAYDTKMRQLRTLHEVDKILAVRPSANDAGEPELHYVTNNKKDNKSSYCRIG